MNQIFPVVVMGTGALLIWSAIRNKNPLKTLQSVLQNPTKTTLSADTNQTPSSNVLISQTGASAPQSPGGSTPAVPADSELA